MRKRGERSRFEVAKKQKRKKKRKFIIRVLAWGGGKEKNREDARSPVAKLGCRLSWKKGTRGAGAAEAAGRRKGKSIPHKKGRGKEDARGRTPFQNLPACKGREKGKNARALPPSHGKGEKGKAGTQVPGGRRKGRNGALSVTYWVNRSNLKPTTFRHKNRKALLDVHMEQDVFVGKREGVKHRQNLFLQREREKAMRLSMKRKMQGGPTSPPLHLPKGGKG